MDDPAEERFCAIEAKVAYHDKDLAELSTTVYQQQLVIDQLKSDLTKIRQQLGALGIDGDPSKDQPPPHY